MEFGFRFRPLYRPLELVDRLLFESQRVYGSVDKEIILAPNRSRKLAVLPNSVHRLKSKHYIYINIGNVCDLRVIHVAYVY
jgi:hypothetical protein